MSNGLVELPSPMQAAAQSPHKANIVRMLAGMIRNATGHRFHLDMAKPVDEDALNVALQGVDISTRMSIKENMFAVGLIRP